MSKNPYAPILHTGYYDHYSEETVASFAKWCAEQGYAGFSMEGKSKVRVTDIDSWIERYMNTTSMGVRLAEENGIDAWLFDEWGYPTGTAAGKTMKDHPEYQSKTLHISTDLVLKAGQTVSVPVPEHFVAASVWPTGRFGAGAPLAGKTPVPLYPQDGFITYTASAVERLVIVSWEFDSTRTVGIFLTDLTQPEYATLDLMNYEAVAFFLTQMHERYLEPFGKLWGKTFKGFFYDEPFLSFPFPYTFDIFEEFKAVKGYDITPEIPALVAVRNNYTAVMDYRDVCTKRMAKAFLGQMSDWCHAHGVEMVGHQDLDHNARTLNSNSGNFFHNAVYNDAPGVDYIWNQINSREFCDYPRFAGSARRLLGKKHATSESFAAAGRSLFPDQMRFALEHQILRGIDRFFLMYTEPEIPEGGATTPVGQGHQQSDMFGKALNHRVALVNRMVNEAKPAANAAVFLPMNDIFWRNLQLSGPGSVNRSPYIWDKVDRIAKELCYSLCDFDYIWEEAIQELPLENGALITPDGQRIDTILICGAVTITKESLEKLNRFIAQGGKVFGVGGKVLGLDNIPLYADGYEAAKAVSHRLIKDGAASINFAHRISEDREYFFLLNENDNSCETTISFPDEGFLSEFDFESESFKAVDNKHASLRFAPRQLRIFSLSEKPEAVCAEVPGAAVALENWQLTLSDGSAVSGEVLGDWRKWEDPCFTGVLTYKTTFTLSEACELLLDLGKVCYAARIRVDGVEKLVPFSPFTAKLSLEAGEHTLEVDVMNTDANQYIGTPEREAATSGDRHQEMYEHDRFRLESGLFGPVSYRVMKK